LVGIFSGALGSFGGPYVAHYLSRRQRKEQRSEQRHAELREMLMIGAKATRKRAGAHKLMRRWMEIEGLDANETFRRFMISEVYPPEFEWHLYRVDDEKLRALGIELDELHGEMWRGLCDAYHLPLDEWREERRREAKKQYELGLITEEEYADIKNARPPEEMFDNWSRRMKELAERLPHIVQQIELRLDELEW
jgi:hypothetical protein